MLKTTSEQSGGRFVKITNHQKDQFFARNNELTSIDCSERVLGQKSENIVRSYFVSRRLNVKEISQELFR